MTALVRTRGGQMVHAANCRAIKSKPDVVPWQWANGRGQAEVEDAITEFGLVTCGTCKPFKPKGEARWGL